MDTATARMVAADWAGLAQLHGALRPEIIRQLVAAYLGRPGAARMTDAQRARIAELASAATRPKARGASAGAA